LERCSARVTLSPINSGSTIYNPRPRGAGTFVGINEYPFDQRRRSRGPANAVAELAVERGVENIEEVAVVVETRQAAKLIATIWHRPA